MVSGGIFQIQGITVYSILTVSQFCIFCIGMIMKLMKSLEISTQVIVKLRDSNVCSSSFVSDTRVIRRMLKY